MNWGNRLLLVFAVFGAGIAMMVYRCMQTPVDLVSKEYYRDELVYQRVIDGEKMANALSERVSLLREGGAIVLRLPEEMKHSEILGSIQFYCPADAMKDRTLPMRVDTAARQEIDPRALKPGRYQVKISWERGGVRYMTEQPFVVL